MNILDFKDRLLQVVRSKLQKPPKIICANRGKIEMKIIIKLIVKDVVEKVESNWFDQLMNTFFGNSEDGKKIDHVEFWYLEIHEESGKVNREIGFDDLGEPIVFLPSNKNPHGFWADSPVAFNDGEFEQISTSEFESTWKEV